MTISADELLARCLTGTWLDLGDRVPHSDDASACIEASLIREMLLGIHPALREHGSPRLVQGVRIAGAVIKGMLDLRDCMSSFATPLPPLLLHRCRIEGDVRDPDRAVIDARHAKLTRLSLRGSRFGRINLADAVIDGELEFESALPLDDTRYCQISAPRSRIDGSVLGSRARLRILPGQRTPHGPDYALDLNSTEINGSVVLQPEFEAIGGVALGSARVAEGVWLEGSRLVASDIVAFRAQSLRCDGVVSLSGSSDGTIAHPTSIQGRCDFQGAEIGSLIVRGCTIKRSPNVTSRAFDPASGSSLQLGAARVRSSLCIGGHPEIATAIDDGILAGGLVLSGRLLIADVQFGAVSDARPYNIDLRYARIDGAAVLQQLSANAAFNGSRFGSEVRLDDVSSNSPLEIELRSVEVAGDLRLQDVSGSCCLDLAHINGALSIERGRLQTFSAVDIEVRGSVLIDTHFDGRLGNSTMRLDGGKFGGEFCVQALDFAPALAFRPTLSLQDARIERDLILRALTCEDKSAPDIHWEIVDVRATALSCYPRTQLVEICETDGDGRPHIFGALLSPSGSLLVLDGTMKPFWNLEAEVPRLLHAEVQVLDYLRAISGFVLAGDKLLRIVERPEDLGAQRPSDTYELVLPAVISKSGEVCIARASVSDGDVVGTAEFKITTEKVSAAMTSAVSLEGEAAFVLGATGSRVPTGEVSAAMLLTKLFAHSVHTPSVAILRSLQPRSELVLTGAKAGAFRPERSMSWTQSLRLRLEGFEYARIELDRALSGHRIPDRATQPHERSRILKRKPSHVQAASGALHLEWLALQYELKRPRSVREYSPQPYEQLARVLKLHGEFEVAKLIHLERLSWERRLVHRWWVRIPLWLPEKLDYGLFPMKSIALFGALLLLGTVLFDFANYGRIGIPLGSDALYVLPGLRSNRPILVLDSMAVSTLVPRGSGSAQGDYGPSMIGVDPDTISPEMRCGSQVASLWYALDVFVPVIDLKQEDKCTISTAGFAWPWRAFKALYALIGAAVTSYMVLAISGVLRRRAEE